MTQARVGSLRVVLTSLALLALTASVLRLASAFAGAPAGTALAFLAGLGLMPLMASPVEWLVHRYVYHRAELPGLRSLYEVHHRVHHHVYFPTWRYVTSGPAQRIPIFGGDHDRVHAGRLQNALVHLAHFNFYMSLAAATIWMPAWLLTRSVPLLAGLIAASVVISDLMITVHDTIHRPGAHPFLEGQAWFRFLDRHHYIHHVDTETNVNFLLPLADWLYGTLRTTLTERELARHGTWEQAKAHRLGRGEPAKEALRAAAAAHVA